MFPSSSQACSSSQSDSRSRKRRKLTTTPNALTAIDSDTPLPDAPRSTPPAPTVLFIILARLTDAKTPHAPRAATPRPSSAAAPPHPLSGQTAVTTTMPSPGNARLDQSPVLNLRPPHLPTKNYPTPPPTLRRPWMWATMATQHPLLPNPLQPRPHEQSRDATAPPSRSQPAPASQGPPPVTPCKLSGSSWI